MTGFCANCAAPLESGTKFCTACGATVEVVPSPSAVSQPSRPAPPPASRVPVSKPSSASAPPANASGAGKIEKRAGSSSVSNFLPWALTALAIVVVVGVLLFHRSSVSSRSVSHGASPPDPTTKTTAGEQSAAANEEEKDLAQGGMNAAALAVSDAKQQSTPVFAPILAPGTRSLASGFSATGDFVFAADRIFLQSDATASFSVSVPQGQTQTVVYGIPAGRFVNNAPVEIWVNGVKLATIAESMGGLDVKTPFTLRLWRKAFGPGNYVLTLKSLGRSVNVYGFWLSASPSLTGDSPSNTPPLHPNPDTVVVQGNQRWSATNIILHAADVVTISATGTVFMGQGWPPMPPAGRPPNCQGRGGFTAGELPCWSLIGRIGEQGKPFYVGNQITFRVPASGQLFLGVNDDQLGDNSGNWTATIAAQSNSAPVSSFPDRAAVAIQAIVKPNQTSVQLPPGNLYLYCMATGGGLPSQPFESGTYAQVTDRTGYLAAALAYGMIDHNQFQTSTWNHVIGGASISGHWESFKAFYGSNSQPGAANASVDFAVPEDALVVVIGLAGGQTRLDLRGVPGLQIDASTSDTQAAPVVIAHAYLRPGNYTATEVSSDNAGQDASSQADLIGVFVFGSKF